MNVFLVFSWVYGAMLAHALWEGEVEGRRAWDKGKLGWKIDVGFVKLTEYHFWLFGVMHPLLLSLPLVVYGWDLRLFGILVSAYASGVVLQDFSWFVFNPVVRMKEWGPEFASYYPWVGYGRFKVPVFYLVGIAVAVASWLLLWR